MRRWLIKMTRMQMQQFCIRALTKQFLKEKRSHRKIYPLSLSLSSQIGESMS